MKEKSKIFFAIFVLLLVVFIYFNFLDDSSENYPSEFELKCLESCRKIEGVNFNWDIMRYELNETYGFIECLCIRKSGDSTGYTQVIGVETKTLYLDMKTFEIMDKKEFTLKINST